VYNFDKVIAREGTSCVKYDLRKAVFGTEDILPMWVADMDFQSPPAVIEAARDLCNHGIFGYAFRSESSIEAFISWTSRRYNWNVKKEWITSSPGIVAALPIAIRALTSPGDKVLIQTPVYPPFHSIVKENNRELVYSPLIVKDGQSSISEEIAQNTITAMAPSKTFNIAGMLNSVIISSSKELLSAFNKELTSLHLDLGNIFGHITMEAAYKYGEEWLNELIPYLEGNVDYAYDFINTEVPSIKLIKPQGSFLLWLDFRETGYSHKEVGERLVNIAKLGLNDGLTFGKDGEGFRRMNIGVPRSVLVEGLYRLKTAF